MVKCRKVVICGRGDERLCELSIEQYSKDFEIVAYASVSPHLKESTVADLSVIDVSELGEFAGALVVISETVNSFDIYIRLTRECGVLERDIEYQRIHPDGMGFASRASLKFRENGKYAIGRKTTPFHSFIVTSSGRSGSRWFAASLHRHPEIACGNGVDHPWDSFRHRYNPEELKGILGLVLEDSGVFSSGPHLFDYLKKELESKGLQSNIPKRDFRNLFETLLREFKLLHESRVFGDVKVLGNIHGMMNNELCLAMNTHIDLYQEYAPVFAQLVRHPVSRFESRISAHAAHLERGYFGDDEMKRIDSFCEENIDSIRSIEKEYNIEFELKDKLFFWFSRHTDIQKHWAVEMTSYDIEHLPFERLKSDPDYFGWAVGYLTRNNVCLDESLIAEIFSTESLMGGRGAAHLDQTKLPAPPMQQFHEWSDWQRNEFIDIAERYDLRNVYAQVGYDLSFVR